MKNKFLKAISYMTATSVCTLLLGSSVFAAQIGIAKQSINIRTLPVDVGKVVGVLYQGEKVTILQEKLGWYYVSKNGTPLGWVSGTYLTITNDSSVASVTAKTTTNSSTGNQSNSAGTAGTLVAASGTVIANQTVNIRAESSTDAKIVGALYKGFKATIIGRQGNWIKVRLSNNTVGYVLASYVTVASTAPASQNTTTATAPVVQKTESYTQPKPAQSVIGVNVRKSPNRTAPIINSTYPGVNFYVLGKVNEWYKVKLASSTTGYILSKYVKFSSVTVSRNGSAALTTPTAATTSTPPVKATAATTQDDKTESVATTSLNTSSSAYSRIAFAKKFIGTPYVWGGTSPSGFDCSGFMLYINKNFGITLQRVASAQATQGEYVDKANLQPGDLVFFDTSGSNTGSINHVGMYIGNGEFIHASSGRGCVTISDLTGGFYASAYVKAKRIG